MKIGVTGGTGFIGSHLIELLLKNGHKIDCLALPDDIPGLLREHPNLQFTEGNILNPASLKEFVKQNQIIIHLAGKPRAKNEEEFFLFNFTGTKNLVEMIKVNNPSIEQIIIMSSQAVVGPSIDGEPLTENAPLNPISPYGRSKAAMENYLKNYFSLLPITIIRAPSVYGPRDRDFITLFKIIKKRIKPIIGKNHQVSFVYVQNLVEGIYKTINNPKTIGEIFFITDKKSYTWYEFDSIIERELGIKALNFYIPDSFVKIAAFFNTFVANITKKPGFLTKEKLKEINNPYWLVSSSKINNILNFTPQISTERGIKESLDWYKKHNWL